MKFSATPSCMIFTLVARNRPDACRSRAADEVGDLLGAAVPVPPQGADDPRGQPPVGGRAAVGVRRVVDVARSAPTIASCQAVMPSECR